MSVHSSGHEHLIPNIRNELIDQLIGDKPKRIPMLPVFGLLVAALMQVAAPTASLATWLLAVTLAAVGWYSVHTRYRQGGATPAARIAAARKRNLFTEATFSVDVIGLVWGFSLVFCHQYPVS